MPSIDPIVASAPASWCSPIAFSTTDGMGAMREFLNTRAKVVRQLDRSEHFGWVRHVDAHQLLVEFATESPLHPGEPVEIELVAPTFKAYMPSVCCGTRDQKHYFSIAKNYEVTIGRFDVRRTGLPPNCHLHFEGRTLEAELVDASLYGLAVLCEESIDPHAVVQVDITMCQEQGWKTTVVAKTVYSRIEPTVSSSFRIGLSLIQMNRLDATRWKSILEASCHQECASFGNKNCTHRRLAA